MRLALALGQPDVDAMLRSMSAEQFAEWMLFYRADPFGSQRQDLNFATLMTVVASAVGDKTARPAKFMLYPDRFKRRPGKWAGMRKFLGG